MKYGQSVPPGGRKFSAFQPFAVPAIITVCSVFAALAGDAGRRVLRLERDAVFDGELWRLVTGHFVHLSTGHLLLNLAGLGVIVFLTRPMLPSVYWWAVVTLGAAGVIDGGLLWLRPELGWYVGLSGILHGFWAAAGIDLLFGRERAYGAVITGLLLAKLVTEQLGGAASISVAITGGSVVTEAHVLGALGGAAAVLVGRAARAQAAQPPGSSL